MVNQAKVKESRTQGDVKMSLFFPKVGLTESQYYDFVVCLFVFLVSSSAETGEITESWNH